MKTGWKILIIVGIFLVVFTGIWLMTIPIQPENAVGAYKKSLREQGEKLEIDEVLPPPVAPESNGVNLVESAFSLLPGSDDWSNQPPAMRMIEPGKALIGWQQPDLRDPGAYGYTNSWANAIADAESNRSAIELLQQVANYPAIDFELDYKKGFAIPITHLMPLKISAQQLTAAMMCDLHVGDAASATTNLCTLLSLVQGEHDERPLISQLVRIAVVNIAAAASWELLQSTNVTDGDLARLQKNWEQMEFVRALENSMTMERAMQEDLLQKARVSNSEFRRLLGWSSAGGWTSSGDWWQDVQDRLKTERDEVAVSIWRTKWSYSDEMLTLEYDQIALDAFRAIETNQPFLLACNNMRGRTAALNFTNSANQNWLLRISGMDQFQRIFSGLYFSPSENIVRRAMAIEACKHIVITAIALKRHQLRYGNFPEKLSKLTPELLPAIPLDPVDGKPLRYRRNADGTFLLYSVGVDGKDDGGDPTSSASGASNSYYWINDHAHDWVWPQPATPAEIQRYYAGLHK
jgi:hypothetical protein